MFDDQSYLLIVLQVVATISCISKNYLVSFGSLLAPILGVIQVLAFFLIEVQLGLWILAALNAVNFVLMLRWLRLWRHHDYLDNNKKD